MSTKGTLAAIPPISVANPKSGAQKSHNLARIKNDLVRRIFERATDPNLAMYSRHGNVHSNNSSE